MRGIHRVIENVAVFEVGGGMFVPAERKEKAVGSLPT
jgi:hypothetical protein